MSQPIYCVGPGCQSQADYIIGDVHTGDQTPLCADCRIGWCMAVIDMAVAAEAEATADDAVARIAQVTAPAGSDQGPDDYGQADGDDDQDVIAPFPATKSVRRSTHGHRTKRPAARKAVGTSPADTGATDDANPPQRPPQTATEGGNDA